MSRSGANYLLGGQALAAPRLFSGNYHQPQSSANRSGSIAVANGIMRGWPFWVPQAGATADRIGVEIATSGTAGALVRLGIWTDAGPATAAPLLLDAGTVDGTLAPGVADITISQALPFGLIWLTAVTQGTPATPAALRTTTSNLMLMAATPVTNLPGTGFLVSGAVTGALPATMTLSPGAVTTPLVHLRIV